MKILVILAAVLLVAYGAKLPDYLKKCKRGPEGAQCVVDNTKAAIANIKVDGEPRFKLQGMTPVHIKEMHLQVTPELKVTLTDTEIHGFETLNVTSGYMDEEKLLLKASVGRIVFIGKYDINGRILILPIQGTGDYNFTLVDMDIDYEAKLTQEERNGKKYLRALNDDTIFHTQPKRVYWRFDNLFNGNERLGPEMNRFLNENWLDVFGQARQAMEQVAAYVVVNYFVNGFLHYIPLDDLFE